jgi:peptide subunit release factor 1 (eRF1)
MKISYYIPKDKHGYMDFINKEIAVADNIKQKSRRKLIGQGLNKIKADAQDGKAFFWDGKDLITVDYFGKSGHYYCDRDFYLEPLKTGKKARYLLIVMDANDCIIGELRGKSIVKLWKEKSNVMGKHNQGGQSAQRFERAREEHLKQWFKKIASKVKSYASV